MRWNQKYVIKSYLRGSLWLVPLFAALLVGLFSRVTYTIEAWLLRTGRLDETSAFYGLSMAGTRSMLETVITLNISFIVFTFGSLLVAIQVAGGQYTPRIIATTLLRDNTIRVSVGCFILALIFALRELMHLGAATVYQLNTFIAGVLGAVSILNFLYLIDYAARLLRPVSLGERVEKAGVAVIENLYPQPAMNTHPVAPSPALRASDRIVAHAGNSGVVLAVDVIGLVEQARRAGGLIEFVPQVGDFLAPDEPLFRLHGGASAIDDRQLRAAVALGTERTMEQDPTFAFRVLVDIAIKALSPAINDPTTAVVVIDQVHRLLRRVGLRELRNDEIRDKDGALRLIFRTPNWEDFVHLACTEIRHCGAGSIQVARRMRSMLENLVQTLPPPRHAELRQQLELLDCAIEEHYAVPADLALARIADAQGLGGSLSVTPVSKTPSAEDGQT